MEGQVSLSTLFGTGTGPRFGGSERIYTMDFSPFLKIKSLDMFVPDCGLVDNILDIFCIAQIWYDFSI